MKTYLPRKANKTAKESSQDEFDNIEVEATEGEASGYTNEDDSLEPYAESLADEEWIRNYRKEQEEKRQLEEDLKKCLENRVHVCDW